METFEISIFLVPSCSYIIQSFSANLENKKKRFFLDVLVVCHLTKKKYFLRILHFF